MSEEVKLDWSSAEVHDGKLVVALEGELRKDWKNSFERTTRLLSRGQWEKVTLKKGRVLLRPITPGQEERVRQFLESVVLQANSAVEATEEGSTKRGEDADDNVHEQEEGEVPEDREMTERVRSFAESGTGSG